MVEELTRLRIPSETVLEVRKFALLPMAEFDWFEDSERFFLWLLGQIGAPPYNAPTELRYYGPKQLSHREACIALVDHTENQLQEKLLNLSGYKLEWQSRLQIGEGFSWVSGENEEEKVRLAFKEISAAFTPPRMPQTSSAPSITNISPLPEPKTYEGLLIHIDRLLLDPWRANTTSKKAKAKWSQLKYKSNKNKSQLNVHIATKATERLAVIAEKHHLSKAKVIEYLINAESEKGLYISEKMAAWLRGDVE